MSLFNIDNLLTSENVSINENTFESFTYKNTTFLEQAIEISNQLKQKYQKANISLHKIALENKKIKYSDFFKEASDILLLASKNVENLHDKALDQFNHYTKHYNLSEFYSLDNEIYSSRTPCNMTHIHNYSVMTLAEDFKSSLSDIDNTTNMRQVIDKYKSEMKDTLSKQRSSYGSDSFSVMYMVQNSDISNSDFIEYLDKSYIDKEIQDVYGYTPDDVYSFGKKINDNSITDSVTQEFSTVFEDMRLGASTILNMVDSEMESEAIPYLSPTEEETKSLRDIYANMCISQFIESMNISVLAAGYKADVLFESLMTYRDVCDKAENRVTYLKENHMINDSTEED